jgi:septal ring factor EnvC (AmiA/AmiB activator)
MAGWADWIVKAVLALGGFAGLGAAVNAVLSRRKTNADALMVVATTAANMTDGANRQYDVMEARFAKTEERAMRAEERANRLEEELRAEKRKVADLEEALAKLQREVESMRRGFGGVT